MVGTITPVVGRKAPKFTVLDDVSLAFLAACCIGGSIAVGGLGIVGSHVWNYADSRMQLIGLLITTVLILLIEHRVLPFSHSIIPRQVPASVWESHSKVVAAGVYGIQMGAGVVTFVSWTGFYILLLLATFVGFPFAFGLGAIYGFAKGLQPIIVRSWARHLDISYGAMMQKYPALMTGRSMQAVSALVLYLLLLISITAVAFVDIP